MPTPRKLCERKRGVSSNSCHRNNNGNLCRTRLKFQRTVSKPSNILQAPSKRHETELSKYIWDLKDQKKSFHVKWRILRSCQPYSSVSKNCTLCLQEKYFIIFRKGLSSLNKRNELQVHVATEVVYHSSSFV